MRIDKFLKNARIIKRRTVGKAACDGGRVSINGKVVKAGAQVNIGDKVSIAFGDGNMTVEVLALPDHVTKDMAENMYRVIS